MRKYAIIIETGTGQSNFSAYVPDLPGCVSVGNSVDEVKSNMQEAIQLHLHGMIAEDEEPPAPVSIAEIVEVPDDPNAWGEGSVPANSGKRRTGT